MRQYLVFGIFLFIYQKGKVNAKQIAERYEISIRTVYRYLDAISYVGIPIITEQGRNGGISILETFNINCLAFSREEKDLIINALKKENQPNICIENIISALT